MHDSGHIPVDESTSPGVKNRCACGFQAASDEELMEHITAATTPEEPTEPEAPAEDAPEDPEAPAEAPAEEPAEGELAPA